MYCRSLSFHFLFAISLNRILCDRFQSCTWTIVKMFIFNTIWRYPALEVLVARQLRLDWRESHRCDLYGGAQQPVSVHHWRAMRGFCHDAQATLVVDIVKVDALAWPKISKHHFLKDIEKSSQEATPIGPEPHHFFPFQNISTNTVTRGVQSFGRNGLWLAGWLSNSQKFFVKFT